jgi:hypothetical protein
MIDAGRVPSFSSFSRQDSSVREIRNLSIEVPYRFTPFHAATRM